MVTTYNPEQTRMKLLEAAFYEIWEKGFRAASMDAILAKAGVTKGALYHHFKNKAELGYAVVDELVGGYFEQTWVVPLQQAGDSVAALQKAFDVMREGMGDACIARGCPLNNLAQEMSSIDPQFQRCIQRVYARWEQAIVDALERGQSQRTIGHHVKPREAALFIISAIQGGVGLLKNQDDEERRKALSQGLNSYLETLKPGKTDEA